MLRRAFSGALRTAKDIRQLYGAGVLAPTTRAFVTLENTFEEQTSYHYATYSSTQQANGQEHDEWAVNESVHGHAHSVRSVPPPRDTHARSQVTGPRFGNLLKDASLAKKPANAQSVTDPQQLWQNLEHEYFSRFRSPAGVAPHEAKEVSPENIKSKSASGVDLNSSLEVQHMLFSQRQLPLYGEPQEDVVGKIQKIIEEEDQLKL